MALQPLYNRVEPAQLAQIEVNRVITTNTYITANNTLKKGVQNGLNNAQFIDQSTLQPRIDEITANTDNSIEESNALIGNAIFNNIKYSMVQEIKAKYAKASAIWLPSTARHKRPLHIEHYGKMFIVGVGLIGTTGEEVIPGEEWGCQCGFQIIDNPNRISVKTEAATKGIIPKFNDYELNLKNAVIATVLGTQFLTHKSNITKAGYLKADGLQEYQDALASGGGELKQRIKQTLMDVRINDKVYNKVIGIIKDSSIIITVGLALYFNDKKRQLIKQQLTLSQNNTNLQLTSNGIFIKTRYQQRLIDNLIDKVEKQNPKASKAEVINFGDLDLTDN